jgi:hypothetical protein
VERPSNRSCRFSKRRKRRGAKTKPRYFSFKGNCTKSWLLTGNYGGKLTNRLEGPRYDGQVLLNMCGCRIRRRLFGIIRESRVFDRIWVARDGVPFWRRFIVYLSFVGERGRNDSSVERPLNVSRTSVERPSNRFCRFSKRRMRRGAKTKPRYVSLKGNCTKCWLLTGNYGGKLTNRLEGPRYDGQDLLNMCGCCIGRRLRGIIRESRVFDRIWVARDGVPFWRRFIVYFSSAECEKHPKEVR